VRIEFVVFSNELYFMIGQIQHFVNHIEADKSCDITNYLLKHNDLKSLCKDSKDGNRAIVRSFRKKINFWNLADIGKLPDKGESRESKDKINR
jgi:hypothetical protein